MQNNEYDASRIANFGRDSARAYAGLIRAQEKLVKEINQAIAEGVKPLKIAHDVMGRCADHEQRVNLLSVIIASVQKGDIPQSIVDPFEEGIRPRRV